MPTDTDLILDLGHRWATAERDADVATLASMVTDDFHLVGPFGFVLDKAQWLDRYASGDLTTTVLSWHDVDVRVYGDAAVTIGTQTQEAAYQGTPSNGDYRVSHLFVRRDGDWAMANVQLSLVTRP